jgi:hypothetical protein
MTPRACCARGNPPDQLGNGLRRDVGQDLKETLDTGRFARSETTESDLARAPEELGHRVQRPDASRRDLMAPTPIAPALIEESDAETARTVRVGAPGAGAQRTHSLEYDITIEFRNRLDAATAPSPRMCSSEPPTHLQRSALLRDRPLHFGASRDILPVVRIGELQPPQGKCSSADWRQAAAGPANR